MLCLRLMEKENIVFELADGRKIKLVHIKYRAQPTIGIEAPPDVNIYREKRRNRDGQTQTSKGNKSRF